MNPDDPKPKTQPAGNKPPPCPPRSTATGLEPDEGSDKERRFGKNLRATIKMAVDGESQFVRRSGGRGHHGHVQIRLEPNQKGKGIEIIKSVPEDEFPAKYIDAAIEGIRFALEGEMIVGGQMVDERCIDDVLVHVIGGSFDTTDSNELAFKMAGIFAVKDALKKTKPVKIG